jgi:hypothetical protein
MYVLLHKFCGAEQPERAAVEHMRANHSGLHTLIPPHLSIAAAA